MSVSEATAEIVLNSERKIDRGGKTLEPYLEQLRVAVALGKREGQARFVERLA